MYGIYLHSVDFYGKCMVYSWLVDFHGKCIVYLPSLVDFYRKDIGKIYHTWILCDMLKGNFIDSNGLKTGCWINSSRRSSKYRKWGSVFGLPNVFFLRRRLRARNTNSKDFGRRGFEFIKLVLCGDFFSVLSTREYYVFCSIGPSRGEDITHGRVVLFLGSIWAGCVAMGDGSVLANRLRSLASGTCLDLLKVIWNLSTMVVHCEIMWNSLFQEDIFFLHHMEDLITVFGGNLHDFERFWHNVCLQKNPPKPCLTWICCLGLGDVLLYTMGLINMKKHNWAM